MLLRRESLLQTIIIIISSSYNIYNTGENKIEKGAEREMKFFRGLLKVFLLIFLHFLAHGFNIFWYFFCVILSRSEAETFSGFSHYDFTFIQEV